MASSAKTFLSNFWMVIVALIVILLNGMLFTVDQRKAALVFQFGEIKREIIEPGIYLKFPFVQNVLFFDRRIVTLDTESPERFITSEKKNVLVDFFVKWRISDAKKYYAAVLGDEERARTRLFQTVNSGLREEFGKRTINDVVSGERDVIMKEMGNKANKAVNNIGISVIDVRLKRVDLPDEVSEGVYRRMEAERKRVADELRSKGEAEAEKIRADADKQREIILAEAYRNSEVIRGEGDAEAADNYAKAYSSDEDFYGFYRRLEAYRKSFAGKNDLLLVDPKTSDFFKHFANQD